MDSSEDQLYSSYTTPKRNDFSLLPVARNGTLDQNYQQHQQTMNRASHFGPPLQHSTASVSFVDPKFETASTAHMIRPDAWATPPNTRNMNAAVQKESTNFGKIRAKLTSTNVLFLVIGLILCGVPLAVLTTLWWLE
ncbi:unnamed protein product [Didymodactylos carnosus]|uniref:Uncharacterized protein n=1 Tax=Didymodactylos carnosus TaxID=1234261 RepID=A0A814YHN3_9BILA|nr:unnamed protein product [Didymodactylos carnosus]CAF1230815.1 unnamed protein product [Didymodactylos carnosus]CAF3663135.1 unnamed protein product [Didymodactylos carnosus]CAF3993470.1 unnamed protein product [Didymodactylos carnosus]